MLICCSLSCQKAEKQHQDQKRIRAIATLFPVYDFAKNVGGEHIEVTLLLPPGVEAHHFEPKPADIIKISEADIFLYTGKYMEPWVEDLLQGVINRQLFVIDASKGIAFLDSNAPKYHEHKHTGHGSNERIEDGNRDPHFWLDLSNAQKMVMTIAEGLAIKDKKNRDVYRMNAESYTAKLGNLDSRFKDALASCEKRVILHGGHFAFNYPAKRYGLTYVAVYKSSPDAEPTPRDIAGMIKMLKQYDLKHIYYEELVTSRAAEIIAEETNAQLLMLHGAHNITKKEMDRGVTFIELMERNLSNLKKGLQCR